MSISRIYQSTLLNLDAILRLDDKASHHLARVLRAKQGDRVTLFNGQGGEYIAVITLIDKKGVQVRILSFAPVEVESSIHIHLAQGIARGEKMDLVVQKAVELGVTHIIPLVTERCNVRLAQEREEKRLQHWQAVIVSACEQSGRNRLPRIEAPNALREWLTTVKADYRFVLSPHAKQALSTTSIPAQASVVLLIGPEGGLSEAEVELAESYQFIPMRLGPRVLRTETATIAAITALQWQYGDLKLI
jgi:16S rRNA (uracil1498-N3)-methyltransferase